MKKTKISEERILKAIKGSAGIMSTIAERLGENVKEVERVINYNPKLMDAYESEKSKIVDFAEVNIIKAIKENDLGTTKWYLSKKARNRGYGDHVTVENVNTEGLKTKEEQRIDDLGKSINLFWSKAEKPSPLHTLKKYIVENGGRAGGKSIQTADQILYRALTREKDGAIICGREIQNSLKTSSKSLLEERIRHFELCDFFEITQDEIRVKGKKVVIYFIGLKEATRNDALKSFNSLFLVWIEEGQGISERTLEKLIPTLNRNEGWQLICTMNRQFENDAIITELAEKRSKETLYIHINYDENPYCPDDVKAEALAMKESDPERYNHIYLGEPEKGGKDSLFPDKLLKTQTKIISFERENYSSLIIACDPSTTNKETSNEYGVIVCGLRVDGTVDIIEDLSDKFSVTEFLSVVASAYHSYKADAVIVEVNQGGDFIKQSLLTQDATLNVQEVRAVGGHDKVYRAQPIANFLSMGRLFFIKNCGDLKNQLARMTRRGFIGKSGESPDRVDALAWAVDYLFGVSEVKQEGGIIKADWIDGQESDKGDKVFCCDDMAVFYRVEGEVVHIVDWEKSDKVEEFCLSRGRSCHCLTLANRDDLEPTMEREIADFSTYHESSKPAEGVVTAIREGRVAIDCRLNKAYKNETGDLLRRDLLRYDGKKLNGFMKLVAFLLDWEGLK